MHRDKGIGKLFVVSTPIGNLKDITLRAIEVLKSVDIIACEDTRQTIKLLNHFEIKAKKLVPYHEHNEEVQTEKLISALMEGKNVALVSDSGTPCVSDPGYRVVKQARELGVRVVPIPGPSAFLAALTASGFPTDSFTFFGFLPRKEKKLREKLEEVLSHPYTGICYESPHRIEKTLKILEEIAPDLEIGIFKEITKVNEEFFKGTPGTLLKKLKEEGKIKGEFVLLFPPALKKEKKKELDLERRLKKLKREGKTLKEAVREIREETGLPKREIYTEALKVFNS